MNEAHSSSFSLTPDEQSIQQLRQAIETMRQAGRDTAALERLLARLEAARQTGSSGGEADHPAAQAPRGAGDDMAGRDRIVQALAERAVAIGRDAFGNFIITGDNVQVQCAPDELPQVLLEAYHRALAHECRQLPLGIIDAQFIRPGTGQPITLDAVYINLDVVSPPREPDEDTKHWGLRLARGEGGERTSLLDAMTSPRGRKLVLLGSAGSGKTTFVNYLTWRMTASPKHREALPAPLRSLLPLRLVLRRVAPYLDAASKAGALWEALRDDIAARLGEEAAAHLLPYIQRKAAQQGALVMLDGLDEVPEAGKRRQTLLQAITAWVNQFAPHSRFLLTARPYAYADPQWHLEGFQIIALAPFNEDQVRTFVQHWYDAVAPWMEWTPAVTKHKREQLLPPSPSGPTWPTWPHAPCCSP
ncbi:MAG TPA: NACHT domain-containing protein [Anaerolineae bacterium]|nr:NACHT domain-containing protein [Anaerolineae bacterium]HID83909.1 NACHT domain-containing protein [Anaerolineales bacterium]